MNLLQKNRNKQGKIFKIDTNDNNSDIGNKILKYYFLKCINKKLTIGWENLEKRWSKLTSSDLTNFLVRYYSMSNIYNDSCKILGKYSHN